VAVYLMLVGAGPASAQTVSLEFQNGRVRLTAQNASVSQILAEWARRGRTTIVNGERVPGPPVTIELNDVSEQQALDVVLRTATGYLVAARENAAAGTSSFDRILILPTSSRPSGSTALQPPPQAAQTFQEGPDDDGPPQFPAAGRGGLPPNPGPRLPQPPANSRPVTPAVIDQNDEPDEPENRPAITPTNPFGVSPGTTRPGVINPGPNTTRAREP